MVLGLLLFACVPKHAPVRATTETPIEVVAVMASVERGSVSNAPTGLYDTVDDALKERNLVPSPLAPDRFVDAFAARRDTSRRLEYLAPDHLTLLTETEVAFYSQLSGRYRWTVTVHLTLAPSQLSDTFEVPVFLDYSHEREPAALEAAAPVIARHVGQLMDAYLAAP